jgi:hypothetical protein
MAKPGGAGVAPTPVAPMPPEPIIFDSVESQRLEVAVQRVCAALRPFVAPDGATIEEVVKLIPSATAATATSVAGPEGTSGATGAPVASGSGASASTTPPDTSSDVLACTVRAALAYRHFPFVLDPIHKLRTYLSTVVAVAASADCAASWDRIAAIVSHEVDVDADFLAPTAETQQSTANTAAAATAAASDRSNARPGTRVGGTGASATPSTKRSASSTGAAGSQSQRPVTRATTIPAAGKVIGAAAKETSNPPGARPGHQPPNGAIRSEFANAATDPDARGRLIAAIKARRDAYQRLASQFQADTAQAEKEHTTAEAEVAALTASLTELRAQHAEHIAAVAERDKEVVRASKVAADFRAAREVLEHTKVRRVEAEKAVAAVEEELHNCKCGLKLLVADEAEQAEAIKARQQAIGDAKRALASINAQLEEMAAAASPSPGNSPARAPPPPKSAEVSDPSESHSTLSPTNDIATAEESAVEAQRIAVAALESEAAVAEVRAATTIASCAAREAQNLARRTALRAECTLNQMEVQSLRVRVAEAAEELAAARLAESRAAAIAAAATEAEADLRRVEEAVRKAESEIAVLQGRAVAAEAARDRRAAAVKLRAQCDAEVTAKEAQIAAVNVRIVALRAKQQQQQQQYGAATAPGAGASLGPFDRTTPAGAGALGKRSQSSPTKGTAGTRRGSIGAVLILAPMGSDAAMDNGDDVAVVGANTSTATPPRGAQPPRLEAETPEPTPGCEYSVGAEDMDGDDANGEKVRRKLAKREAELQRLQRAATDRVNAFLDRLQDDGMNATSSGSNPLDGALRESLISQFLHLRSASSSSAGAAVLSAGDDDRAMTKRASSHNNGGFSSDSDAERDSADANFGTVDGDDTEDMVAAALDAIDRERADGRTQALLMQLELRKKQLRQLEKEAAQVPALEAQLRNVTASIAHAQQKQQEQQFRYRPPGGGRS